MNIPSSNLFKRLLRKGEKRKVFQVFVSCFFLANTVNTQTVDDIFFICAPSRKGKNPSAAWCSALYSTLLKGYQDDVLGGLAL